MPVSFGGKTAATNIVPLCHTRITIEGDVMGCNNAKTAKHPERWLIEQFGVKKGKEILERINRYFESLGVQDWWKSDAWR